MTSATEFENVGNQPPYSRINARWDAPDDELDNDNSSARLFERSRIKALAGTTWGHGGQKVTLTVRIRSMSLLAMAETVCESWYGSNRTPLPSSESTPSPGSTGFSSLSQNPPLLPKCLRGREVLTLAVGGFCPLSLSQVVWNQSQKCEDTLGEGVPEGPHRHKFKRCPVHLVLCLCMERNQLPCLCGPDEKRILEAERHLSNLL